MENELAQKFDYDPYLERLLEMRETDPNAFSTFPEEVKKMVEEYARCKSKM